MKKENKKKKKKIVFTHDLSLELYTCNEGRIVVASCILNQENVSTRHWKKKKKSTADQVIKPNYDFSMCV